MTPQSPGQFPAFFIVGVPRSGTTLARAIVTGHPRLTVPPETGFLPRLLRLQRIWWPASGLRVAVFTRLVFANGRLAKAGLHPGQLDAQLRGNPPASPAEAVSAIYELFADSSQVAVGDKTPGYVDHVQLLGDTFPHAQFVHMVRHPLDVIASLRLQPWGPDDPVAAAQLWLRSIRRYAHTTIASARLRVVRLEDLVADPDATVDRLCAHLGVSPHPDMLSFASRGAEIRDGNLHPSGHAGLLEPLAATRTWERDLPARDAARAWALVQPAAERLGYAGPAGTLRPPRPADATRRLAMFELARSWRRARTIARMTRP